MREELFLTRLPEVVAEHVDVEQVADPLEQPHGLPHLLAVATLQTAVGAAVAVLAVLLALVQAGTAGGLVLAVVS